MVIFTCIIIGIKCVDNILAKKKFEECSKIVKRIAFEKAIACDYDEKKLIDSIKPEEFGSLFFPTVVFNAYNFSC